MADHFTQFSFVIQVTPEQGGWLTQMHGLATTLIDRAEDGGAGEKLEGPEDVVSAALRLAEGRDCCPDIEVVHEAAETGSRFGSEISGDVDYTADLVQAFLRRFDLDVVVAFEWSYSCSKPQVGAFGGGAVVISRRNVDWFNTATLVETAVRLETERLTIKPDGELEGTDLDDAVHDIASSLATDANNDGIGAQLDFLLEHGWSPPAHMLREVVS